MIKIVEDSFLNTKARFYVQLVNDDGDIDNNIPPDINNEYHHITKEYVRFINHYQKLHKDILGMNCFIPEVWAVGLVDIFDTDHIEAYDKDFTYVVCAFCVKRSGKKYKIDYDILKECLRDICNKAQSLKVDVAIPWSDAIERIVKEIFSESTVNVLLIKS